MINQITAKLSYLRIAPRKVRLVADLIRGKKVAEAQTVLKFTIKRGSEPLLKLLKQAVANAKNNFQIDQSNLYISKIVVDEGPKLKRRRPRAKGRSFEIQKKTSHIVLALDMIEKKKLTKVEKKEVKEKKEKKEKVKKEKPKFKPILKVKRNKVDKGVQKIFRRKAF